MSLIRKECGVNASKNDPCTASTRLLSDLVAPERVACVQSNANHIASLNGRGIDRLKRLIDDRRISPHRRGSRSKNIEPSRSDDRDAKRHMAWID